MTCIIALFAIMLIGFANDVISKTLVKNNYTAKDLMRDDYKAIKVSTVLDHGGGVQIINTNYKVVFSEGLDTISKEQLSVEEFTNFLIMSNTTHIPYSYSIEYNPKGQFWLIVTFPTSYRIDFAIVHNRDYTSVDTQGVIGLFTAVIMFYLLLLGICTVIYSKLSSLSIINPLKKLCNSAKRLKDGDYSSRVELNLKNEFGELESIFNQMAEKIEQEMSLRVQSEENRKKLVLDISHDLKNPLASIVGYAEFCKNNLEFSKEDLHQYIEIIYDNSLRANHLINDLFELSKMESTEYTIHKTKVEICEYMRKQISCFISTLDKFGFFYEFRIPEKEIFLEIDQKQMERVLQNLVDNAVKYNPKGTKITINLIEKGNEVVIIFKDNGIGMSQVIAKDIFQPFVRGSIARNYETGGTGLGLAIVEKILKKHGGSIYLETRENCGCTFVIAIPKI